VVEAKWEEAAAAEEEMLWAQGKEASIPVGSMSRC
jgi:hypothetical protein